MKDFTFYNPTRMEFGKDKENNMGQYVSEYGLKKVLVVYGSERVKKNGLFGRVTTSLKEKGIEFVEIGGVVSNPLLSKVYEAIELAKKENVDGIIAVGGGSVLDSVKAISAGAKYDGDVWDFFIGKAAVQAALPLFSVLTLAATGSEMNCGAVVTNDETKEKFALFGLPLYPTIAVINPELMATVSDEYLAYSAVDIIAHCLDTYLTATTIPTINLALYENIMKRVMETTDTLLADPSDYDARAEFAWASTMALNGVTWVGNEGATFDSHMIGHALSALHNVPHGASLSLALPAWMQWEKERNMERFQRFAKEMFSTDNVDDAIDQLEAWFKKINSPTTLSEMDIPADAIPAIAENAYGNAQAWGMTNKYKLQDIQNILESAK